MSQANMTDKKERLHLLLQQIDLPEPFTDDVVFQDAYLEKLELYAKEKKWVFHLVFNQLIDPSVYEILQSKLKETFAHIAHVEVFFDFGETSLEKVFETYWSCFIQEHMSQLNGLGKRLSEHPPNLNNGHLTFLLSNHVEMDLLGKRVEPLLKTFYGRLIPSFSVKLDYQIDGDDHSYEQFIETRDREDEARAEQTRQELVQMEQDVQSGKSLPNNATQGLLLGKMFKDSPIALEQIIEEESKISVQGYIFQVEIRELKSGRHLLMFDLTDYTNSLSIKAFSRDKEDEQRFKTIEKGMWVQVRGSVQMDTYQRELVMMAQDIQYILQEGRQDTSTEKRVELHLHTNMSAMDGLAPVSDYIAQAAKWGHQAIAVTDHGVVQSFPEAYSAGQKHGIKILYGMEAYLVDDGVPIVYDPEQRHLQDETYVVFDIETTGLSAVYNQIIEIAAVKMHGGKAVETFERFANPHEPISAQITQLTGITDDMVKDAADIADVLQEFKTFMADHTLVAHNASFDMGFLQVAYRKLGLKIKQPVLDTLELGRYLFPELKSHRLNVLCKKLNIKLDQHHRALHDSQATAKLMWTMLQEVNKNNMTYLDELNERRGAREVFHGRPTHCILFVQNQAGLKNMYKLVSLAHLKYYHRVPRIPRSVLNQYREGLLVGSSCEQGEVFNAVMQKSIEEAQKVAEFYDYLEIQPLTTYAHLIEKQLVTDEQHIQDLLRKIVEIGKVLDKPVIASGNVHYVDPQEKVHRQILVTTLGGATSLRPELLPDVHLRTTEEMLQEFAFLGEEQATQVVIENTQSLADQMEEITPVPKQLYTPNIAGADEEVRQMCVDSAMQLYGDSLPDIVQKRLEKELNSIITNGFAVIYLISHKLVKKSLDDGYLVGSRGSVGSSFVATMMQITEVNPLPPHYVCTKCHHHQFITDGSVGSGFDLGDKDCPDCGQALKKDGHDIPFETFLGFKGDKVPDIDLNFSGHYQPVAHKYTQELFGIDNVFRAGTIGTVADKTAYGFVKKYEEEHGNVFRQAEINRLAQGCTGVKRTTGQHPGGIIVVPDDKEIYDFTPIQFPADDVGSEWRTTHFDFHSIHDNLLKLDILGHDDPTMIRMLQDLSGIDPEQIPTDDAQVMQIFSGPDVLGVTEEQIMSKTGTLGIPEFGTRFVRQMLEETRPTTFAELVRISGLSHGTDVWLNNAQQLIQHKTAVLAEVISTRDDIMVYLIHKGLDHSRAFQIMEKVRKGKGLSEEDIAEMKEHNVPPWYITSCQKIKYMFPKAHAVAYVLMAIRIAYFKVHHPIYFYAAYFSVRADDFDNHIAVKGTQTVIQKLKEINEKGNQALPKEKNLVTILELCLEMLQRGFSFHKVDLYRSASQRFIVLEDGLLPPLNSIPGVGSNAAIHIEKAREDGEFLSKEDIRTRSKVTKTVLEALELQGCLEDLPETNQLSLF